MDISEQARVARRLACDDVRRPRLLACDLAADIPSHVIQQAGRRFRLGLLAQPPFVQFVALPE